MELTFEELTRDWRMRSILVAVRDETLLSAILEVLSKLSVEIVSEPELTLDKIEEHVPSLIIIDYSEKVASIESLFKAAANHELTSHIPFMFIIPESAKWNEIDGFRLGFDTKVSRERPRLGIQLRVQAILKKGRPGDDPTTGKVKDMQTLMQAIMKKAKAQGEENAAAAKAGMARAKVLVVEDEPLT